MGILGEETLDQKAQVKWVTGERASFRIFLALTGYA
jgi:hypothetical protein